MFLYSGKRTLGQEFCHLLPVKKLTSTLAPNKATNIQRFTRLRSSTDIAAVVATSCIIYYIPYRVPDICSRLISLLHSTFNSNSNPSSQSTTRTTPTAPHTINNENNRNRRDTWIRSGTLQALKFQLLQRLRTVSSYCVQRRPEIIGYIRWMLDLLQDLHLYLFLAFQK